jgi:NADH-quinone oxidoreductase subunit E
MLTDEERREIESEIARYPAREAASIDALKIVQRHRGWISDESIQDIAGFLKVSPTELDGIATFYNLIFRKPVGRHVILLCDSVSCWITGYERVREHLCSKLAVRPGQTTSDDRFTLIPIVCLGCCDRAPAMMIGDDLHVNLDPPEKCDAILEQYK